MSALAASWGWSGKEGKKNLSLSLETTRCLLLPPSSILAAEFIHGDRASRGGDREVPKGGGGKEQTPISLVDSQKKTREMLFFLSLTNEKKNSNTRLEPRLIVMGTLTS